MAERDQVGRALGRLDRGDARDAQHVALLRAARAHQRERLRLHRDAADGTGHAVRDLLASHVDHVRLPGLVEVGKMGACALVCAFAPRRRRRRPGGRRGLRHRIFRASERSPVNSDDHSSIIAGWLLLSPRRRRLPARSRECVGRCPRRSRSSSPSRPRSHRWPARSTRRPRHPLAPPPPPPRRCRTSATRRRSRSRRRRSERSARRRCKQLRAAGAYLNDPEVNDYLNELGQRLVAARNDARADFHFFGVPDPSINAFAMPGGFIGVNTGLILLTQTESELASVLAHEITHVTQNHMARMLENQKNSLWMSLAALAVAILAARAGSSSAATWSPRRSRRRRRSRSRTSSTSRARTSTRPTGSGSSVSTWRASTPGARRR